MLHGWRITTINGLLLALYFVPAWTNAALKIVVFPIRGIYAPANIGPALFVNDTFHLATLGTVRFAWLLALVKFVVVACLLLFTAQTVPGKNGKHDGGDEVLTLALLFGSIVSVASMAAAAAVAEAAALRLHATESLLLLGGLVLLVVESQNYGAGCSEASAYRCVKKPMSASLNA
ncbi:hypothetical protein [Bradyrhizobium sp. LHD-71]|uniref:hypothetical protein n=1 Tax=Bradyrhizobium sp. LHD-71 TaxID=3072141 RepID=UPI00280FC21F|nr:hypothetical protein [Bradyrhizobium sp. LHD-71]MDQ8731771.1 hypothetical protein [Bradyrhizobium sp. LHD-71]